MNYRRFQIVKIIERVEQLINPLQNVFKRKRLSAFFQHSPQIVAFDQFHHQKLPVEFGKIIADEGNRFVAGFCQRFCLALKGIDNQNLLFFVGWFDNYFFERDRLAEPFVNRLINRAHSAVSKLTNDSVTPLQNFIFSKHLTFGWREWKFYLVDYLSNLSKKKVLY